VPEAAPTRRGNRILGLAVVFAWLCAARLASASSPPAGMDERAPQNPTSSLYSTCSPRLAGGILLAEVPTAATVPDLIWLNGVTLDGPKTGLERRLTVTAGDTFLALVARGGVKQGDALPWYQAAKKVFDLARLRPGNAVTLSFDKSGGDLVSVEYEIDRLYVLRAERTSDGITARREELPTTTEVRGVAGTIASNITADCLAAGVPNRVIRQMTGIFSPKLNLKRLRDGDAFRVLYEVKVAEDGEELDTVAQVLAAEVETRGTAHTAILTEGTEGPAYVDLDGRPMAPAKEMAARYPLTFTRISSGFSTSRVHPITRRRRPHYGVDFAAPHGTPVRAIADGKIAFAGWNGELGRALRIDHLGSYPYDSIYGHLTKFASGIGSGSAVRRGQVIGYVGSTGLSTGPHLHFALVSGKRYVDPLKALGQAALVAPTRVAGKSFERRKTSLVNALGALDHEGPVRLTRMPDTLDL